MESGVGDGAREVQSEEQTHSLCVLREEDRTAITRQTGERFRGAGEDFICSLKICAHLQEHLWEPVLIWSKTPSNIFVTPDISSCEAMVNVCGWEKMFLVENVNEIASMHY